MKQRGAIKAFLLACAPLFLVSPHSAYAKPRPGPLIIDGNISCADFVGYYHHRNGPDFTVYQISLAYAEGFLSGVNVENFLRGGPQLRQYNRVSAGLFFYNYCSKHPLQSYAAAISQLEHYYWKKWRWPLGESK